MSNWRAAWMAGLVTTAGLTGCLSTTRVVPKTQALETFRTANVEMVEKELADRDDAVKTLDAQVLITASTGGSKEGKVTEYSSFKGYIFVSKPENLRVILQLPLIGSRALDMVSDGARFTLMRASSHGSVWVQGSNQVTKPSKNGLENLRPVVFLDSLMVPGVKPGEYVTLTESTRTIQEARKKEAVEEPVYELNVLRLKEGAAASGAGEGKVLEVERVIHISRVTMLPYQQDIYDANGQVVTQALYANYQTNGGEQFPAEITIRRPADEYTLKIDVTKLVLNETFEEDKFTLDVPPGAVVQKMD